MLFKVTKKQSQFTLSVLLSNNMFFFSIIIHTFPRCHELRIGHVLRNISLDPIEHRFQSFNYTRECTSEVCVRVFNCVCVCVCVCVCMRACVCVCDCAYDVLSTKGTIVRLSIT